MENLNVDLAHNLRRSGQISEAIILYNNLIISNPNNPEYIFGKALCYLESDPLESIKLFKKVIDINPNIPPAYSNIIVAANNAKKYNEAIKIFDELILKFPDNFELLHQRAILIGNNGDNLSALIDCYRVIESTVLKDDVELFRKHQISTDIAFAKVQLINETNRKKISNLDLLGKYENIDLVEYQYQLPHRLFGNEKFYLEFGKYQGYSINEILKKDPSYIIWCILNLDIFCVSEDIIGILKSKNINIESIDEINTAKLKLLRNKNFNDSFE